LTAAKAPAADDYATTSQIKDFGKKLDSTPAFLWMVTEGNDRRTQVHAGRAYARVQLAATAHGLAMQPLQQALQEYPEQTIPYADIRRALDAPQPARTVQMWARVGFAPPVVLSQFQDPLIYLLLGAIAISLAAWVFEGLHGWPVDAIVIALIVHAQWGAGPCAGSQGPRRRGRAGPHEWRPLRPWCVTARHSVCPAPTW
jgi:hypothetical protein